MPAFRPAETPGFRLGRALNKQSRLSCDTAVLAIGGGATEVMLEEVAKRFEV